jgi:hypothetical protein
MVQAVGAAQISVNGGGGAVTARDRRKKIIAFFTFYDF